MPATSYVNNTGIAPIDGLLSGVKWATRTLTYSFPTSNTYYGLLGFGYGFGEPLLNFNPLNEAQKGAARASFDMYSSVANLTFREMTEAATGHADLRLAESDMPSTAWASYPSTAAPGGDMWFNNSSRRYDAPMKGNYAFETFMHEMGHAMGLEHPHEGNPMPYERHSIEYTVMSYRSYVAANEDHYRNETWGYPQSLMMYDIAALQHMYGANYDTNSGDTVYSWNPNTGEMYIDGEGQGAPGGNRIFLTVWDGGGTDTYDFSNYRTDLKVDLRPGAWTTTSVAQLAQLSEDGAHPAVGNIANALLHNNDSRSLIENAKGGAGNDTITGNAAANTLWGNGGDDTLRGREGDDNLLGGPGADFLDGGAGFDFARYDHAAAGVVARLDDPSSNTGEAAGDRYSGIEGLVGSRFNDVLVGDAARNDLNGLDGNDILIGGGGGDLLDGGAGGDMFIGGAGADTVVFDGLGDVAGDMRDCIMDFTPGADRIDLRGIDADVKADGDQAFSFIGDAAFDGGAGQLRFSEHVLSGDVDGDRIADFQIEMPNVDILDSSNFYL